MPHATEDDDIDDKADQEFRNVLIGLSSGQGDRFDADLEPGEKADDAVDFGDLSDDDLAEDDGEGAYTQATALEDSQDAHIEWQDASSFLQDERSHGPANGTSATADAMDELFGDVPSPSIIDEAEANEEWLSNEHAGASKSLDHRTIDHSSGGKEERLHPRSLPAADMSNIVHEKDSRPPVSGIIDASLSREQRMQQALFEMSGSALRKLEIPGPETQEQALKQLWPRFERATVPKFMDLLPQKRARYLGKPRVRPPKPVHPTKLNLEIAMDQEKSFRLASASIQKAQCDTARQGFVAIQQCVTEEEHTDVIEDLDSDFEHDATAGFNWQDLQIMCEDWDTQSSAGTSSVGHNEAPHNITGSERHDTWDGLAYHQDQLLDEGPVAKVNSHIHAS